MIAYLIGVGIVFVALGIIHGYMGTELSRFSLSYQMALTAIAWPLQLVWVSSLIIGGIVCYIVEKIKEMM